jgi:exonuclease SbcC
MRLLSLELENWACHDRLTLDLSGGLQIEGRNGSGKTSILEAIKFIFAESAIGQKGRIQNGARSARVSLSFSKDGNSYLVEKELFVDRPSTARMLCNETVVGDNPTSVHKSMHNILDENIFEQLLYIPQGGLTSIVERLSKKRGRSELDSLFGFEKFDRVYRDSAVDVKEAETKLASTIEQLARHPQDAAIRYADEIAQIDEERKRLILEITQKRDEANKLDAEIAKADSDARNLEGLKRKLESLRVDESRLAVQLAKAAAELDNVEQRLGRMTAMAGDLRKFEESIALLRKYPDIRENLAMLEKRWERQSSLKIDKDRERLVTIRSQLAEKAESEKEYAEAEKTMRELESVKTTAAQELKQQETHLRELDGLEGSPTCPRCGQKLTLEHLGREKAIGLDAAKNLREKLRQAESRLAAEGESLKKLKETVINLEKLRAEEDYLKKEVDAKAGEEKALSESIQYLKKKLYETGYADESPDAVDVKVGEYNKILGELEQLKKELSQKDELEEKRKTLAEAIENIKRQIEENGKSIRQIPYNEVDLNKRRQAKEELTGKKYAIERQADKEQSKLDELATRYEDVLKKRDEFEKLRETRKAQESDEKLLKQSREVFHTDKGIQKYLRDRYISQLNNLLTYYFKRLNENPRYSEIVFDKEYEIQIKATDGSMGIEQLSGGEKIQLAIALRIALTEILSNTRLLILDEPFGSLDRNHREILGETLNKIAASGQLIVVTHVHVDSLQLERKELGGY